MSDSDELDGLGDEEAFRAAMSDVAPLKDQRKIVAKERGPQLSASTATLRQQQAEGSDEKPSEHPLTLGEVAQVQPYDELAWKKDGVQTEVFNKLRNGGYPIERQLDLRGLTVEQARDAVRRFIETARGAGVRAVLIAHGRGERSATPARLKSFVAHWLEHWDVVLAFHSAQRQHGGTGAVYCLLRKSAAKKAETRERYGLQGHDPDGPSLS